MTGLPTGWRTSRIGDVAEVGPKKTNLPPEAVVSFVPMQSVEEVSGRMDLASTVTAAEGKRRSLTYFENGDVIFAKITPCMENGKIALAEGLVGGAAFGSTEFHVLRPTEDIDGRYLRYYLVQDDFRHEAARAMTGAVGQRRVPKSFLAGHDIPLPPLDEQRRIVAILEDHLSRLDTAQEAVSRSERRLAGYHLHVMKSLVLGTSMRREDAPVGLVDVGADDSVVVPLPHGWQWGRLGDIADVVGGVTKDSKKQSNASFVEVPYLRVANVQRGRLELDEITTIRVPPIKAEALQLREGDVLLNEGGDRDKLGRGWVWQGQIPQCIHQNHVFRARVKDAILDPFILSWAANTLGGRWCELNGKQSVNLASISLSKIRLMPVPIPPKSLQGEIRTEIEDIEARVQRLKGSTKIIVRKGVSLRRALLAAAFSGQLTKEFNGV